MREPSVYVNGVFLVGLVPLGVRIVAGPPTTWPLKPKRREDLVPGRNARSLAESWGLIAVRKQFAGQSPDIQAKGEHA